MCVKIPLHCMPFEFQVLIFLNGFHDELTKVIHCTVARKGLGPGTDDLFKKNCKITSPLKCLECTRATF